jgi:hypothetical protein
MEVTELGDATFVQPSTVTAGMSKLSTYCTPTSKSLPCIVNPEEPEAHKAKSMPVAVILKSSPLGQPTEPLLFETGTAALSALTIALIDGSLPDSELRHPTEGETELSSSCCEEYAAPSIRV